MSTVTMEEELTLVLTIRDTLQTISPNNLAMQLYRTVEPELLKLLYAKNKDLADIAYQKIRAALEANLDHNNAKFKELDDLLTQLLERRQRYLTSPSTSFLSFWAEQGWTGANYALLILPFILGTLFPPAGIALLIYTIIVTVAATIDLGRKSPEFWLEETSPDARELSEQQRDTFEKNHGNIDLFLPEKNLSYDPVKKTNFRAYLLYTLVFVIALVALGSLLFPPIGIPVVALTILSIVALAATGMQFNLLFQKQQQQLAEIQYERNTPYLLRPQEHDSTELISQQLPKDTVAQHPQVTPQDIPHIPTPLMTKKIVENEEEKKDDNDEKDNEGSHLHH